MTVTCSVQYLLAVVPLLVVVILVVVFEPEPVGAYNFRSSLGLQKKSKYEKKLGMGTRMVSDELADAMIYAIEDYRK